MIFSILKQTLFNSSENYCAKECAKENVVNNLAPYHPERDFLNSHPILFLVFSLFFCLMLPSPTHAGLLNQEHAEPVYFDAKFFYQALTAEIYRKMGDDVLAVEQYQYVALESRDPAVARYVTILAAATGQLEKGLKVAEHWVTLAPDDLESRQYLALLYLRNNKIKLSSEQFHAIHTLVSETSAKDEDRLSPKQKENSQHTSLANAASVDTFKVSQELVFIGAILAAETHREKAYRVFAEYIKQHESKMFYRQQKLIAANLALKAKNYKAVMIELQAIELQRLKHIDPQNWVDAMSMKAKALHKLNKNEEAIHTLMLIQESPKVSDSSRLELIRLFVLQKQKEKALPILEKLIVKHEQNNDLLKSLIALQIDQGKFSNAEKSIHKLRLAKSYIDDADYFSGELSQARGNLEKALKYYEKVNGGSFLKNAHQKVIYIMRKIKGNASVTHYFEKKQSVVTKSTDKAYWLKLHADHLFGIKHYSQALAYYNQAVKLSPKNPRYYYYRGLLHERMRKLESAENDFNHVLSMRKNDADALNALGSMLLVNTQRLSEAKNYISKAYQLKPHDPVILDSLGFAHFKNGNFMVAEKYLRQAFKLTKKPKVASHLINVLTENGKRLEALRVYQEMSEKFPDNNALHEVKHLLYN